MEVYLVKDANGQLVHDAEGRVAVCDSQGHIFHLGIEELPENFEENAAYVFLRDYTAPDKSQNKDPQPSQSQHSQHTTIESPLSTLSLLLSQSTNVQSTLGQIQDKALGHSQSTTNQSPASALSHLPSQSTNQSPLDHSLDKVLVTSQSATAQSPELNRMYIWSENATKNLISLYKEKKEQSSNKSIKKNVFWKEIAKKLAENGFGNPTSQQVEDKFKNLRKMYAKIKDSMGPNASGAPAPERFKYYNDMDDIFAQNPSFTPPLIIGSRRAHEVVDITDVENAEEPNPKKKKVTALDKILTAQEARHKDILKEIKSSREMLAEKLDKLIEKF